MALNEFSTDILRSLRENAITFSRTEAAKIVGSKQRLQRLINQGAIHAVKDHPEAQNGRWRCPAEEVLWHARPKRTKTYWEERGIKKPKPYPHVAWP